MPAYFNLVLALRQIGDLGSLQEAVKHLQTMIKQNYQDYEAHYNLGYVLEQLGQYDEALQSYRTTYQLNPSYRDAYAGEASVYEKLGDPDTAYEKIRPFLNERPPTPGIVNLYGKIAAKLKLHKNAIELIEQLLDEETLDSADVMQAHFALGSLYDQVGRFDDAFLHFREGNEIKPIYFDRHRHSRVIAHLTDRFSKDYLCQAPHSAVASDRPIFVIGMPRSGTSLVEQILSAHPSVHGAGELDYVARLVDTLPGGLVGRQDIGQYHLDRCAREYLAKLDEHGGDAPRVVDKMPQNFMHLAHIELFFPNCHIVHCKRNALDTSLSCYFQCFSAALSYAFDLDDIGFFYKSYETMMAHWNQALSIPIRDVVYEDLVANPEQEIRKLISACNLQWDDKCLDFYKNSRIVLTASYDQVRQPTIIHRCSDGRTTNFIFALSSMRSVVKVGCAKPTVHRRAFSGPLEAARLLLPPFRLHEAFLFALRPSPANPPGLARCLERARAKHRCGGQECSSRYSRMRTSIAEQPKVSMRRHESAIFMLKVLL